MTLAVELQQVRLAVLHDDVDCLLLLVVERLVDPHQIWVVEPAHDVDFLLDAFSLEWIAADYLLYGYGLVVGGKGLHDHSETTLSDLFKHAVPMHC